MLGDWLRDLVVGLNSLGIRIVMQLNHELQFFVERKHPELEGSRSPWRSLCIVPLISMKYITPKFSQNHTSKEVILNSSKWKDLQIATKRPQKMCNHLWSKEQLVIRCRLMYNEKCDVVYGHWQ